MKKYILITLCCVVSNIVYSQDYHSIYQCGFEDNENLSVWDLQTADTYNELLNEDKCRNYFFVGNATSFFGDKSLYVSDDNGVTDSITATQQGSSSTYSTATLQIMLTPGNYTIDFLYNKPDEQNLFLTVANDRFCLENCNYIAIELPLPNTENWTNAHAEFTVTEEMNWILFDYMYNTRNGGEKIRSIAIDNIVIKKEGAEASVHSPLIDNLKIFTNNRIINIENAVTDVEILDVTGRIVAQVAGNTYEVAQAGVYIVRANGTAKKVIIQ